MTCILNTKWSNGYTLDFVHWVDRAKGLVATETPRVARHVYVSQDRVWLLMNERGGDLSCNITGQFVNTDGNGEKGTRCSLSGPGVMAELMFPGRCM